MSINNQIRVIKRLDAFVTELKRKYPHSPASPELARLSQSLNQLLDYLASLNLLQPNQTTNEIDKYMIAINMNLDLLKNELDKADYQKLHRGMKVIKTILKFHPTRYSFIEFMIIWTYELIYFI